MIKKYHFLIVSFAFFIFTSCEKNIAAGDDEYTTNPTETAINDIKKFVEFGNIISTFEDEEGNTVVVDDNGNRATFSQNGDKTIVSVDGDITIIDHTIKEDENADVKEFTFTKWESRDYVSSLKPSYDSTIRTFQYFTDKYRSITYFENSEDVEDIDIEEYNGDLWTLSFNKTTCAYTEAEAHFKDIYHEINHHYTATISPQTFTDNGYVFFVTFNNNLMTISLEDGTITDRIPITGIDSKGRGFFSWKTYIRTDKIDHEIEVGKKQTTYYNYIQINENTLKLYNVHEDYKITVRQYNDETILRFNDSSFEKINKK